MRWNKRPPKIYPERGTKRTVKKFIWFPKCLNGQWRWLDYCGVIQEYAPYVTSIEQDEPFRVWDDIAWADQ